jgi:hypothetical protein
MVEALALAERVADSDDAAMTVTRWAVDETHH